MEGEELRIGWRAKKITVPAAFSGVTATVNIEEGSVSRATGSWIDEGINPGDVITFTGFADAENNVDFTVTSLTAAKLFGTTAVAMKDVTGDSGVGGLIGTRSVKEARCKMAQLRVLTGAIEVTPYDDTVAMWDVVTSAADLDLKCCALEMTHKLKLKFSAAGSAWVIFR